MSDSTTPTFTEVIKNAIEARLVDVHTSIPGEVVAFYPEKQMADVQPALKRKFANGKIEPLPVVTNVPVVYPRSSNSIIYFPLSKGDSVLMIFAERSIDRWAAQGGIVDPADVRKFHLSDAVCIPGPYSAAQSFTVPDPTKMFLLFGEAMVQMNDQGKFKIGQKTNPQIELLSLFSQTLQELSTASTATGPLLNAAQFAALKLLIDQMKDV